MAGKSEEKPVKQETSETPMSNKEKKRQNKAL